MGNVYVVYDNAVEEIIGVFNNMKAARQTVANHLAGDLAEDSPLWDMVRNGGDTTMDEVLELLASPEGPQYYESFDMEIQTFELRESPSR